MNIQIPETYKIEFLKNITLNMYYNNIPDDVIENTFKYKKGETAIVSTIKINVPNQVVTFLFEAGSIDEVDVFADIPMDAFKLLEIKITAWKKCDEGMKFADMTDKQLQQIVVDCNDAIASECNAASDYTNFYNAIKELEARGYKITGVRKLKFKKTK